MNATLEKDPVITGQTIPNRLEHIKFVTVTKILCHRRDIVSFINPSSGQRITSDKPWFGAELANLGKDMLCRARMEYSYYCGFAGDVYFYKNTRRRERVCDMPANASMLGNPCPPCVGDLIMGEMKSDPEEADAFIWWIPVMVQDWRFAKLILGQVSYSATTLEQKLLVIGSNGERNMHFVRLAKEHLCLS